MGRVWKIALLMWLAFAMDAAMAEARVLAQVDVPSPSTLPIWELRRGDDRLVILSDFWPRRRSESVDFSPARLSRVAAEAEVFVSAPGVAVDDSVSVWRGIWLWRAYRQAVRNPDHGRLRDLLPPDAYASWAVARARFLGAGRGTEFWRPWYAAFKLYEAAMKQQGIGRDASLHGALQDALKSSAVHHVDARYRMKVDLTRQSLRAFEIDLDESVACLLSTLDGLAPTVDTAGEGADAWDSGDLDALRAYYSRVPPLERCWERLINQHTAELQGAADPYAQVDSYWLDSVHAVFREKDIVLTYLPARVLVSRTGVVGKLMDQGFVLRRRD